MTVVIQSFMDELMRGDVFGAAVQVFDGVVPVPIVALLVFGTIGTAYYMVQRSPAIPVVMFVLVGGVTVAEAPTTVQQGITALAVLFLAGIGYTLLQRVRT